MKTLIIVLLAAWCQPQDLKKTETTSDELKLNASQITVVVDNIYGEIQIKRNTTNSVKYNIRKTMTAESSSDLNKGWEEVKLNIISRNDSLIFYLSAPFICDEWSGCQENGRWVNRQDDQYDFSFDYTLEVPAFANLNVQTIDKGEVNIAGVEGVISANNVNGSVLIKEAKLVAEACTVNGNVDVYYQGQPNWNGVFKTINGTINLYCNQNLNARVSAKTMHGSLYTAFDYTDINPELKKVTTKEGAATLYTIDEEFAIEIGKNGPSLTFETLNGNIFLRKL